MSKRSDRDADGQLFNFVAGVEKAGQQITGLRGFPRRGETLNFLAGIERAGQRHSERSEMRRRNSMRSTPPRRHGRKSSTKLVVDAQRRSFTDNKRQSDREETYRKPSGQRSDTEDAPSEDIDRQSENDDTLLSDSNQGSDSEYADEENRNHLYRSHEIDHSGKERSEYGIPAEMLEAMQRRSQGPPEIPDAARAFLERLTMGNSFEIDQTTKEHQPSESHKQGEERLYQGWVRETGDPGSSRIPIERSYSELPPLHEEHTDEAVQEYSGKGKQAIRPPIADSIIPTRSRTPHVESSKSDSETVVLPAVSKDSVPEVQSHTSEALSGRVTSPIGSFDTKTSFRKVPSVSSQHSSKRSSLHLDAKKLQVPRRQPPKTSRTHSTGRSISSGAQKSDPEASAKHSGKERGKASQPPYRSGRKTSESSSTASD